MATKTMNTCIHCNKPGVFVYSRINASDKSSIVCDEHILTISDHRIELTVGTQAASPTPAMAAAAPTPMIAANSYMDDHTSEIFAMRAERLARYAALRGSIQTESANRRAALTSELTSMRSERESRYNAILRQMDDVIQSESITRRINTCDIHIDIEAKKRGLDHVMIISTLDAQEASLSQKINST